MSTAMRPNAFSTHTRHISARRLMALPAMLAVAVSLAACSTSTGKTVDADSTDSGYSSSADSADNTATETTDSAAGTAGELVPVVGLATDDVYGNSVNISGIAVIPGSDLPADVVDQYSVLDGGALVVVKASVTAASSTEYYLSGFPDTLQVEDATGLLTSASTLEPIVDAAADLGYAPAIDLSAGDDLVTDGYLLYTVNRAPDQLSISMKRSAAAVTDGTTIPEKTWNVASWQS